MAFEILDGIHLCQQVGGVLQFREGQVLSVKFFALFALEEVAVYDAAVAAVVGVGGKDGVGGG